MKNPFMNKKGKIKSPYRMLRDLCLIWPTPPPERIGEKNLIEIPEFIRSEFQDGTGILLSVGPGYYDKDDKYHPTSDQLRPGVRVSFDKSVPWITNAVGNDKKTYKLVMCTAQDIHGVVHE